MGARHRTAAGGRRGVFLCACLLAAACGRPSEPPAGAPAQGVAVPSAAVPAEMKQLEAELRAKADQTRLEIAQDARDRAELVTPAPAGFKPVVQGRKVELKLIPRKTMIRKGERFWYRAEIRNIGSEFVTIIDPFIDSGFVDPDSKFSLVISPHSDIPIGDLSSDICELGPPPDSALPSSDAKGIIRLAPGEILRTRDWQGVDTEAACAAFKAGRPLSERPGGLFREFPDSREFSSPGTYRVHLVMRASHPEVATSEKALLKSAGLSDSEIAAMNADPYGLSFGPAESKDVSVEVLP